MSLTLRDLKRMAETQLMEAGVPDYENDAEILMEYCFGLDRTDIFMNRDREIDEFRCDNYLDHVYRRSKREPLQYITGTQCFMGIDFKVTPDVLIPRQDTERVVTNAKVIIESRNNRKTRDLESPYIYEWIEGRRNWKVLDLCCGSGAIGISLAKICGNLKKAVLTDISEKAVSLARVNAIAAGMEKKISVRAGNMFEPLKNREKFDMIISNPPYIPSDVIPTLQPEVKDFEPVGALDGGADGLDYYRQIVSEAPGRLEKEGILILETGHDQGKAVTELINDTGKYQKTEIVKDYGGNDRVVIAVVKR